MPEHSASPFMENVHCPQYATCERINKVFSHQIPACMAIRMSEEVCLTCPENTTTHHTPISKSQALNPK